MQLITVPLFIALGLLQLFAIIDGVEHWVGIHWLFAGMVALLIAPMPLLGTVVGFAGAVTVWEWAWWQAGLLFFGTFAVVLAVGGAAAAYEAGRKWVS